ncbi:MAG TPA: tungsten ABC transporter substrate-binding protein [Candidatus Lambdaproteobacteria bacterium]|nr:tungsten ABC transporter substrate-binding protein [Deltaproteobacteria bacterium]HHZ78378.1 tungsten ABC transporter substrate-binding protein [Candidatus Lambdaproteobacteria bacterium]HIA57773.1 tungsten ABC transporter substrate-binding protein [Candidatus Lambdaproteobacteria bacterium]HIB46045.1 tungsten ABC transporter substrate-binding protein [Candidatus Lambdaproteobacteria bacterium]HIB93645.1 tungsten ABC transporter substrate-binding protein [Candidatus Lambdaproteobacteria bact
MKKILIGFLLYIFSAGILIAEPIRLATTTSTENSGLLKVIIPLFEKQTGNVVHVLSVGTGHALRLGQDGNVDVVLVHAPKAELRFVEAGYGVNRRSVMVNDFVIVGPENDPAEISVENDSVRSIQKIARGKHIFVSRGDDSGTHKKELSLWEKAKLKPEISWYREVGQGMGRVLQMANELNAYTISDRGTWLVMRSKLSLKLLTAGDTELQNPYSIIAVNPARYPRINYLGAMSLIAWLTSVEGQNQIRKFRLEGQPLFIPTAIKN